MSLKHQIALSNSGIKNFLKVLPLFFIGVLLLGLGLAASNANASTSVFSEIEIKKMQMGMLSCDTSRLAPPLASIYEDVKNNLEWSHEGREWLFAFANSLEVDSSVTVEDFRALLQCQFSNNDWMMEQARVHLKYSIFEKYREHLGL